MSWRRSRLWIGALLAAAMLGAPGAVDAHKPVEHEYPRLDDPFILVSERTVLPAAADLRGSVAAFASAANGSIDIVVASLPDRTEHVVSSVPSPAGTVRLNSLAFDGEWVVWSDDRAGQFDVFAAHVDTGALHRVTDHPEDDIQVDVDNGTIVWTRRGTVLVTEVDANREATLAKGIGFSPEPQLSGNIAVWGAMNGTSFWIEGRERTSATPVRIASSLALAPSQPRVDGDVVVWAGHVWENPERLRDGFGGTIIQLSTLPPRLGGSEDGSRRVVNLTTGASTAVFPAVGGGLVSWVESLAENHTRLVVRDIETGDAFTVAGPAAGAAISDAYVVFPRGGPGGILLYAVGLDDVRELAASGESAQVTWPLVIAGGGLLAIGIGWGAIRKREA